MTNEEVKTENHDERLKKPAASEEVQWFILNYYDEFSKSI